MWLAIISWVAVAVGLCGTWVAGKRHYGWLFGAASAMIWISYDTQRHIWAGLFAALVSIFISVRNYMIGRTRVEQEI